MNFTKKSKFLLNYLNKHKIFYHQKQNNVIKNIITYFYYQILDSYYYSINNPTNRFIKKIISINEIIKPISFNENSFSKLIIEHINNNSKLLINYEFRINERLIKVNFILENDDITQYNHTKFNNYCQIINIILYFLNNYALNKCAKRMTIFIYFTSLEKQFPRQSNNNINSQNIQTKEVLDVININSAFTYSCPKNSEIIIYRSEEWIKVLIHELIHNLGIDFSDLNDNFINSCILKLFKVNSKVNAFEAYTEFWAELINVLFTSFIITHREKINNVKVKTNEIKLLNDFLSTSELLMNYEVTYSLIQLIKVLDYMNLDYSDLINNNLQSQFLRENNYRENTNVLSYYILKCLLIVNYQDFLIWCLNNNFKFITFTKTSLNLNKFCKFLQNNYKSHKFLSIFKKIKYNYYKLKQNYKNNNYFINNLRMSIIELG